MFYALFFFACMWCQNTEAKLKEKPIYMFGFAISFADSLAYYTDVQYIESSVINTKNNFLMGRNMYSVQFQEYLQEKEGCKHPVTSIYYGEKKKKMEKKLLSIRRKYEKERLLTLKNVACNFEAEAYEESELIDAPDPEETESKAGKKGKKSKEK